MKPPFFVSILTICLAACGGRSSLDDFGNPASPDSGSGAGNGGSGGAAGNGGSGGAAGNGGCPSGDLSCANGAAGSSGSSSQANPAAPDGSATGGTLEGGEAEAGARGGTGGDSGELPRDAAADALTVPPVACGNTSCARGEECCIRITAGGTASTCIARGAACTPGVALTCTDGADCPGDDVCCLSVATGSATCEAACAGGILGGNLQLCSARTPVSDCPAGDLCLNPPLGGLDLAICVPDFGSLPAGPPLPGLGAATR